MTDKEKSMAVINRLFALREQHIGESGDPIFVHLTELAMNDVSKEEVQTVLKELMAKKCYKFAAGRLLEFDMMVGTSIFSKEISSMPIPLEEIDFLALFQCKQEYLGKKGKTIIKAQALEHIARKMGDLDGATGLIKMLHDCEVPDYLIIYPNTKWRMLDDIFRVLATSTDEEHHQILFRIFEEFTHPLRYGGDKERAQELQDFVADLICYDNYYFNGRTIMKTDPDSHEHSILMQDLELDRDERKKERSQKSVHSMAAMSDLFQQFSPSQKQQQQQKAVSVAEQHNPVHVVIHNQNVQQNPMDSGGVEPLRNKQSDANELRVNELAIDLNGRALRNMHTRKENDITGVFYTFLKTLIDAQGALVTYEKLAEALRGNTVKKLTEKDVMDVKGRFTKMLREELQISEVTSDEVIQGKDGYRISRKIYENNQKKI